MRISDWSSDVCSSDLVSARTVPFGALGMAVFSIDLYFASAGVTPAAAPALAEPLGALAFLGQAGHWRILADLLLVSMFGGLYIVPLYAIVQQRAEADYRSEEHTSELQVTNAKLVCRLLLE